MTIFRCEKCGRTSTIHPVYVGKTFDDAWGHPKWYNDYEDRTTCCNAYFTEEPTEPVHGWFVKEEE